MCIFATTIIGGNKNEYIEKEIQELRGRPENLVGCLFTFAQRRNEPDDINYK